MIEVELGSWMVEMFGGKQGCVTFTSGGTESIMVASFSLREWTRQYGGIKNPEILCNESTHPAWIKAAYYMDIKVRMMKIDPKTGTTNIKDWIKNLSKNTMAILMTNQTYPHGSIDPIEEMNAYLVKNNINTWIAIDSCLGGYFT